MERETRCSPRKSSKFKSENSHGRSRNRSTKYKDDSSSSRHLRTYPHKKIISRKKDQYQPQQFDETAKFNTCSSNLPFSQSTRCRQPCDPCLPNKSRKSFRSVSPCTYENLSVRNLRRSSTCQPPSWPAPCSQPCSQRSQPCSQPCSQPSAWVCLSCTAWNPCWLCKANKPSSLINSCKANPCRPCFPRGTYPKYDTCPPCDPCAQYDSCDPCLPYDNCLRCSSYRPRDPCFPRSPRPPQRGCAPCTFPDPLYPCCPRPAAADTYICNRDSYGVSRPQKRQFDPCSSRMQCPPTYRPSTKNEPFRPLYSRNSKPAISCSIYSPPISSPRSPSPMCSPICSPICSPVCPPKCSTVCPPKCSTVCPPKCSPVCPPKCSTVCPPKCSTVCPPLCSPVCPAKPSAVCPPSRLSPKHFNSYRNSSPCIDPFCRVWKPCFQCKSRQLSTPYEPVVTRDPCSRCDTSVSKRTFGKSSSMISKRNTATSGSRWDVKAPCAPSYDYCSPCFDPCNRCISNNSLCSPVEIKEKANHMCPWQADVTVNGTVRGHCTCTAEKIASQLAGNFRTTGTTLVNNDCAQSNSIKSSSKSVRFHLGGFDDGSRMNFSRNNRPSLKPQLSDQSASEARDELTDQDTLENISDPLCIEFKKVKRCLKELSDVKFSKVDINTPDEPGDTGDKAATVAENRSETTYDSCFETEDENSNRVCGGKVKSPVKNDCISKDHVGHVYKDDLTSHRKGDEGRDTEKTINDGRNVDSSLKSSCQFDATERQQFSELSDKKEYESSLNDKSRHHSSLKENHLSNSSLENLREYFAILKEKRMPLKDKHKIDTSLNDTFQSDSVMKDTHNFELGANNILSENALGSRQMRQYHPASNDTHVHMSRAKHKQEHNIMSNIDSDGRAHGRGSRTRDPPSEHPSKHPCRQCPPAHLLRKSRSDHRVTLFGGSLLKQSMQYMLSSCRHRGLSPKICKHDTPDMRCASRTNHPESQVYTRDQDYR